MLQHTQVCTTVCDWLCLAAAQRLCEQAVFSLPPGAQTTLVREEGMIDCGPTQGSV